MKTLFSIIILLLSMISSEVQVAFCDMVNVEKSITEIPGENESDPNSSEELEEDAETDHCNMPLFTSYVDNIGNRINRSQKTIIVYFMEIPDPPPDQV